MNYLPIFADVSNKRILVAGGGEVALSKLRVLLKTSAHIEVYASKLHEDIQKWASEGKLTTFQRALQSEDIKDAVAVYSTYFGSAQNEKIAKFARDAGVWVNVVDAPLLSDFISPAIVDRDPVVVAIGTEGAAPVLARKIKTDIEERLSPDIGLMARVGKRFRYAVEVLPFGRARRDFWASYYENNYKKEEEAQQALEKNLNIAKQLSPQKGLVNFVSAGPGDPELLTLKARKIIDKADVVIHDRLVSKGILELARREAKIIEVGKKGYGKSWVQDDINALIVEEVIKGQVVVRLKGGDACIFGRLDEEIEALNGSGIEYNITPGVTSACAAAASLGMSLTKRGRNSEIRFLTARDMKGFADHDWRVFSQKGASAAIYMGVGVAYYLQGRLLMNGADPATPISILENISLPNERIIESSIATLSCDVEAANIQGPAIIMLGLSPKKAIEFEEVAYA